MTEPEPHEPYPDNTSSSDSDAASDGPGYDEAFAGLVESYDTQIGLHHVDPDTWRFPVAAPREHLDLGIAGSLTIERTRAVHEHQAAQSRASNILRAALGGVGVVIVVVAAILVAAPIWFIIGIGVAATAAAGYLILRSLTGARALALDHAISAERQAAATLQSQLAGTGWTLLYDRLVPDTEQRLPFLAVGAGGVVSLPLLPPGVYAQNIESVFTVDQRPISEWLTWRYIELRQLGEALIGRPNRDINFEGTVRLVYLNTRTRGRNDPPVPISVAEVPICTPLEAAQLIRGMPAVIPRHAIPALVRLVNDACPPAPQPDQPQTP